MERNRVAPRAPAEDLGIPSNPGARARLVWDPWRKEVSVCSGRELAGRPAGAGTGIGTGHSPPRSLRSSSKEGAERLRLPPQVVLGGAGGCQGFALEEGIWAQMGRLSGG